MNLRYRVSKLNQCERDRLTALLSGGKHRGQCPHRWRRHPPPAESAPLEPACRMPFVRIEQAAALLDAGYNAFDCPGEVIGADRIRAAALPAALSSQTVGSAKAPQEQFTSPVVAVARRGDIMRTYFFAIAAAAICRRHHSTCCKVLGNALKQCGLLLRDGNLL